MYAPLIKNVFDSFTCTCSALWNKPVKITTVVNTQWISDVVR